MTNPLKIPGWPEAFTPQMPGFGDKTDASAANPAANAFAGGMDFVKSLWGGLPAMPSAAPGFVVPTFDLDELDKRIKDLKAVHGWLEVNLSMLNATIQGLEVQRNTIAAVQAISGSMESSAANFFKPAAASPDAAAASSAGNGQALPDWGSIAPGWPNHAAAVAPTDAAPMTPKAGPEAAEIPDEARVKSSRTAQDASPQAGATSAWIGYMQDQFAKIASAAALAPTGVASANPGSASSSASGAAVASASAVKAGPKAGSSAAEAKRKPAPARKKSAG